MATQVELDSKQVLEVSCGHGGGASYLVRTLHPSSYTGLDFNPDGIAFCQKRHQVAGLDFMHGDAENLPFADRILRRGDQCRSLTCLSSAFPLPRRSGARTPPWRPFPLRRFPRAQRISRLGRSAGRHPVAEGFGTRHQSGGAAGAGEELAAVNRVDRPSGARVSAPLRPPFRRCTRHGLYNDIESGKIEYRMYCFTKD